MFSCQVGMHVRGLVLVGLYLVAQLADDLPLISPTRIPRKTIVLPHSASRVPLLGTEVLNPKNILW